jgi:hypothetical protein
MKKFGLIFFTLVSVLITSSAFVSFKSSNGIAGYTGSPGEGTCSAANGGCHSVGATSTVSGLTLTSSPAFVANQYIPGTVYTISLSVGASGYTRFGFGCEVLNVSNVNTGTLQAASVGTKFLTAGNGRRNAVQNGTQLGPNDDFTFVFNWVAPAAGSGNATFYYVGNAVNGSGSSGDFVIPPASLSLTEDVSALGSKAPQQQAITISVYPNPAQGLVNITYNTNESAKIGVFDIHGKLIKAITDEDVVGNNTRLVDITQLNKGVYFLRLSTATKQTQKLLIVN